ncbi:hypothetical protein DMENIID0001_062630 [Sergentomyia squamirostris]
MSPEKPKERSQIPDNLTEIKEEIAEVCRVCETMENLVDISSDDFAHLNEKLHKISQFEANYSCWLKYICVSCSSKLESAFNFKEKCELTYRKLVDKIKDACVNTCLPSNADKSVENPAPKVMGDEKKCFDLTEMVQGTAESHSLEEISKVKAKKRKTKNKKRNERSKSPKFDKTKRSFICEFCDRAFSSKQILTNHIEGIHVKKQSYSCEECGAKFLFYASLYRHRQIHTNQSFSCDLCGKSFNTKRSMERHRKGHTEPAKPKAKVLLCHICGHGSSEKYHHAQHLRRHLATKPYQCEKCDRSFDSEQGLKNHQKFHTSVRPFKCTQCSKAFRLISHLNSHMISHTGERKFKCDVCEKSFTQSGSLKIHLRLHTGEKPFHCRNCGAQFRLKRALLHHKDSCCSTDVKNEINV